MRYSLERERVVLSGLAEVGNVRLSDFDKVVRRRKRACSSRRVQYGWLRISPCANMPNVINEEAPVLSSPRAVSEFLHAAVGFSGRGVEYFMVLCLSSALQPMAVAVPHRGGRATSVLDQSVVLQAVILSGASSFVIAHNRLGEGTEPSSDDVLVTKRIAVAAPLVGLKLRDHVVLTDDPEEFSSFADRGLL
jgi:DNA repair protein RadC